MTWLARRLACRALGHVYPPVADVRFSRRARNGFGGRGVFVPLGARARRREQERARVCVRCGERRS